MRNLLMSEMPKGDALDQYLNELAEYMLRSLSSGKTYHPILVQDSIKRVLDDSGYDHDGVWIQYDLSDLHTMQADARVWLKEIIMDSLRSAYGRFEGTRFDATTKDLEISVCNKLARILSGHPNDAWPMPPTYAVHALGMDKKFEGYGSGEPIMESAVCEFHYGFGANTKVNDLARALAARVSPSSVRNDKGCLGLIHLPSKDASCIWCEAYKLKRDRLVGAES